MQTRYAIVGTGGRARKSAAGYDLTHLITGADGTLGIITEATLKLTPLAQAKRTLQAIYRDIDSASRAVSALMAQPVTPCALEFMDARAIDMVREYSDLGLPPGQFWSALIGFNLGVEIGQLSVIAVAAVIGLAARRVLRDPAGEAGYRSWIVRPGSALIGLTGLWWGIARLSGFG